MRRREACLALAAAMPLAGWAKEPPQALSAVLPALRPWGSGEFRRFGFLVYEATLWAGEGERPVPPLALGLTYKRNIEGKAIAEASVDQMRRFDASDAQLARWGQQMAGLFPSVKPGDRIVGLQLSDRARFFYNDQPLGEINDAAFARAFFAIWLDPRTSEPSLRTALLTRPAG
jgi:hypothetical protein